MKVIDGKFYVDEEPILKWSAYLRKERIMAKQTGLNDADFDEIADLSQFERVPQPDDPPEKTCPYCGGPLNAVILDHDEDDDPFPLIKFDLPAEGPPEH